MTQPAPSPPSRVLVIGGGPAGLTAAAECASHGLAVTVLEKDPDYVGGIARTVRYKDFRFDIGGHRFFSKSPEITRWWQERLPNDFIQVRRLSRIFYNQHFFDYPLKAFNALRGLGLFTSVLCLFSYARARLFPIRPERSFADWVTNRFGQRLFNIFFKTYTEKVWGMPCDQISADWAAQRIKGLSLSKAILNALFPQKNKGSALVKTLIDSFQYPRLGPGMMWEKTAADLKAAGHPVLMGHEVIRLEHDTRRISAAVVRNPSGAESRMEADSFIVSMPLQETIRSLHPPAPPEALAAADRLQYRDFLTVALMVRRANLFPDNWIYVHDPSVKLGRIQNFNNWSPDMVPGADLTCLGLEYFCFENDGLWSLPDPDLIDLGKRELARLGLVQPTDVFDGCVVRMPKAYPVYTPTYTREVQTIRQALAQFSNLQVVGRNGMHKYNNQDHSMMTALLAARNLIGGNYDLWRVNTDAEYHEEGDTPDSGRSVPRSL